jgi:endonuclease/exonuclease/phosphatase family metal-dependent hydrolase
MRHDQYLYLERAFPEHRTYGITKTATCSNPINAIFYHAGRFDLISAGGYWLSETPHLAGSRSWKSASIRLANWMRLRDHQTGREFRILNTHLDHMSELAKMNQVRMILDDTCMFPANYPQIMTGDLNMDSGHPLIHRIKEADWWDSYQKVHHPEDPGNTYHGFLGADYQTDQGKIDWIFAKGELRIESAEILRDHENKRYPSDHYFVQADILLLSRSGTNACESVN